MSTFSLTAPFSGIADGYEQNDWNPDKLWNMGVRIVFHKMGQWSSEEWSKIIYLMRKADWIKRGGIWGAYYLPFASDTADIHFANMEAVDQDATILRAIDWEPDGSGDGAKAAPVTVLEALVKSILVKYKRLPLCYSYRSLFEQLAQTPTDTAPLLKACDAWFANPNGGDIPKTFDPVNPPANTILWQWSSDDTEINQETDGWDFSAFNGDMAAAVKYFSP